jgi:hypothetical protein
MHYLLFLELLSFSGSLSIKTVYSLTYFARDYINLDAINIDLGFTSLKELKSSSPSIHSCCCLNACCNVAVVVS